MAPVQVPYLGRLLPRDPTAPATDDNNGAAFSISPSLIVGICILVAIFFCVILATTIRLCTKDNGTENTENLYRPYDPHQIERLHEVRRINNKMAWDRGRWAKLELLKQGRRMTVGMDDAMDSLSTLEGQNGYDTAHQQYLHLNDQRGVQRGTHMRIEQLNPYADPNRRSRMLQARRVQHAADKSDDSDEDIDMETFPHLPGLPGYVTSSDEALRRSPGSEDKAKDKHAHGQLKSQGKASDSHAYLGPAIKKMSSGLEDLKVGQPPQTILVQQHSAYYNLGPEPSPKQSDRLMQCNPADFENISLDDLSHPSAGDNGRESDSDDVKSDITIKPVPRVAYEEDYSALPNPIGTAVPLPPPSKTPVRDDMLVRCDDPRPQRQEEVIETQDRTNLDTPIIMINHDATDPDATNAYPRQLEGLQRKDKKSGTKNDLRDTDYLVPFVNISFEAGAGDLREISIFEPREADDLRGRYWSGNVG